MIKSVWIVEGWFGDHEWYEPHAHLTEQEALAEVGRLSQTGSDRGPGYARHLHNFAVAEVPLSPSSDA